MGAYKAIIGMFIFGLICIGTFILGLVVYSAKLDINGVPSATDKAAYYYYDSIKSQLSGERIAGSHIEDYNYSTKELTVKLANGEGKIYKVNSMPAVVENEEVVNEEILSKFYTYLFQKQYYDRVKIVDWNEGDRTLVFESGDKVITLRYGVGSFYEVAYLN